MKIYEKYIINKATRLNFCVLFVGFLLIIVIYHLSFSKKTKEAYDYNSIQSCLETYKDVIVEDNNIISLSKLGNRLEQCIRQTETQAQLNEFEIRRQGFAQQRFDENVFLWMVVGITISGVVLAGLQLAGAYSLAKQSGTLEFSKDSELILEHNRISLKSSVTGLLILVVSVVFFLIFVLEIYVIKELDNSKLTDRKATQQEPGKGNFLGGGQIEWDRAPAKNLTPPNVPKSP